MGVLPVLDWANQALISHLSIKAGCGGAKKCTIQTFSLYFLAQILSNVKQTF
jgi:hypothetical protein